MKKLSIVISITIITTLSFMALINISKENQYTSVRQYSKPKPVTSSLAKNTISEPKKEVVVAEPPTPLNVLTATENQPKTILDTTPPVIEFVNYKDGDIVNSSLINIQVKVTDDISPSEKITIEWAGRHRLKSDFNPIVVTAKDEAGNTTSSYIIIEKR